MPLGLRITAIIAAYNEADIIGQTVGDLVRQGIAAHVLDNHSTDGTVAVLEPFEETGLVRIESFPPGASDGDEQNRFSLARILARKEQLARELDADWFINHDADEFRESPWLHLSLREGIELVDRLGYNAIDFAVLNFWPTGNGFEAASDIREVFRHFAPAEAFDRTQIRCWKKTESLDLESSGGHDAQFPLRRVFPVRFILRHYPIRSQAHGTRKVFKERKPRFSEDERRRGWHVHYDAIGRGHQFLRDPKTLRVYDPEEVRVDLQIHHRELETLNEASRRALQAEAERYEAKAAEGIRLVEALAESEQAHQRLLRQVESLEQQLVDVKESWSWRLTAPLRAIWGFLR
jgi:glycosyltransferase involved in cell wall biosynthesis